MAARGRTRSETRQVDAAARRRARDVGALRREWNVCQLRLNAFRWLWRETADWPDRFDRPGDDRGLRAEIRIDPVIDEHREATLAVRDRLRERAVDLGVSLTDIGPDPKQDGRRASRMPEWEGLVAFKRDERGHLRAEPVWAVVP